MAEHQPDTEYTQYQEPQPAELLIDRPILAKATEKTQVVRGTIKYAVSAEEWYSRNAYDNIFEKRGTVTVAQISTLIDFSLIVKYVEITCPMSSSSDCYVNFGGAPASSGDGNVQVRIGETRGFWIPVRYIQVAGDGTNTVTYRVTYQW
jgi:hypothetical protein